MNDGQGMFQQKRNRMRANKQEVACIYVLQLALLCIGFLLCTVFHVSDTVPALISIMVIGVGSLLFATWLKMMCTSPQSIIIFGGYILRIICVIIDLYCRDYITLPHSTDSEAFYAMACRYYDGDYSEHYTWYPYVIRGIFAVFGQNRMVAQYINVIFWVFTVILIIKFCEQFHVPEHSRLIAFGLMAFFPNNIMLSSVLMRESFMIFMDLWGLYYLIRWMEKGRFHYLLLAFLVPIPAIILHTASIGMWAAVALIAALWDRRKQRFVITIKSGIVLAGFVIFLCVLYFTDLSYILMSYFGNLSIYSITHREFRPGNADYLKNMDCQYWYQLVPFTLVRMFYFICSPVLTECRGLKDYLCVLGDVLPTLFVMLRICINMRKKAVSPYIFAGMLNYVIIVGIFAWGTANAGAALRHRGLIWGILVATYCMSAGRKESGTSLDKNEVSV